MAVRHLCALCTLTSAATGGCSTLVEVQGSPLVALPSHADPSFGGGLAVHGGIGTSSEGARSTIGFDTNAKLKATVDTQHIAFGNGFFYTRPIGGTGAGILRAGLHLVFERFDEKLLVGGGPYAAILGGVPLATRDYFVPSSLFAHMRRDRTLLTFGPIAEIDARFSRPSAVGFVGLALGIAWTSEVLQMQPGWMPGVPPPRPQPLPF